MLSWKERFRALATMLVRPRATMRRVLEQPPDRMIVPLILLAVLSSFVKDLTTSGMQLALKATSPWLVMAILIGAFIVVSIFAILFVYALAWVAMMIGRFLEGNGTTAEVRSALAWGLAPVAWALLIRIPLYFLIPPPEGPSVGVEVLQNRIRLDPGAISSGCGMAAMYLLLDLVVTVAYLVITCQALGEAHRFSAWRALATLLLSFVAPAVVMIAAVLAVAA